MKISKVFKEIGRNDAHLAGGKGASLGEMTQAKLPVPPGFVILAESFDYFVEKAGLEKQIEAELKKVKPNKQATVDKASEVIRKLILDAKMPEEIKKEAEAQFKKLGAALVAVRSSATAEDSSAASWAGELETYLNVTNKNLLESIKLCWSSLFTPRAIFYRFEKKLDKHAVSVAVVVQKMIQSEVSGIAFTVHPVTHNYNQMIIEAGYGLGEAIVGGMITPDMYVVEKGDMSIAEINISEQEMMIVRSAKGTAEVKVKPAIGGKQKLAGKKIVELAKICVQIEKHYGFPCDIEWAMEKNKLYITQSRPITTL